MKYWKRSTITAYIIIFLVGILLFLVPLLVEHNWGDKEINLVCSEVMKFLKSLGTGLIGTSTVIFITLPLVFSEKSVNDVYKKWGLTNIYSNKSEINGIRVNKDYKAIALGLKHLRKDSKNNILQKKNIKAQIITINPKSPYLREFDILYNTNLTNEVSKMLSWLKSNRTENLEVRYYNEFPKYTYFQTDDKLYISDFRYSDFEVIYEYTSASVGWEKYTSYFDQLWDKCDKEPQMIPVIKREEFINAYLHSVIKEIFYGSNSGRGIVPLYNYKDRLRHTVYSTKTQSNPKKTKDINFGVVGIMNEISKSILYIFRDDKSPYYYMNNNKKIECEYDVKGKGGYQEDILAILTAPIYDKEIIIGALTIEFLSFPDRYLNVKEKNKGLDMIHENQVKFLLKKAESCAKILEMWYINYSDDNIYIDK